MSIVTEKAKSWLSDKSYWLKTKSDTEALRLGCYVDLVYAERVIEFCSRLQTETGESFLFLDWQLRNIIYPLFCWRMPDGSRRFNAVNIFTPRGNGKTYCESAIAIAVTELEDRAGEMLALIAPGTEQANISYENIQTFLFDYADATFTPYKKRVEFSRRNAIQVLASENNRSTKLHGYKGAVILDELHGLNQQTYEAAKTTSRKSQSPLLLSISTVGKRKRGLCWDIYSDCKRIISGQQIDIHTLPVIYEVDSDRWTDFEAVCRANPGVIELGQKETLRQSHNEALQKPHERDGFLQLNCNIWGSTISRWFNSNDWASCYGGWTDEQTKELPCYIGVDLSKRNDLTSIVCIWVDDKAKLLYVKPYFYLPNRGIEDKEDRDEASYTDWAKQGDITLIESDSIEFGYITDELRRLSKANRVVTIGFDPKFASFIMETLVSEGISCKIIYQGGRLEEACKELETRIETHSLKHNGNAVLTYCSENVCKKVISQGCYPAKENESSPLRIDGISALVIAIKAMLLAGDTTPRVSAEQLQRQFDFIKRLNKGKR